MSRRFGRNQRRRAREALAASEAEVSNMREGLEMISGLLRDQSERIARNKEFMAFIAKEVGEKALIAGEETFVDEIIFDRYQIPVRPTMSYAIENMGEMHMQQLQSEVMRVIQIDGVKELMRAEMAFYAKLGNDRKVIYAISERALRQQSEKDLVRILRDPITKMLAAELKKEYR